MVRKAGKKIYQVCVEPEGARAPEGVIRSIESADVAVLAPGSLLTSTIPVLLGGGVRETLVGFGGPVLYAVNAMTQPGETNGFSLSDHLRALEDHAGPVLTDVLVYSRGLPRHMLGRYEAERTAPVVTDREEAETFGVRLQEADLLSEETTTVRHDRKKLAEKVCEATLIRS